MEGEDLWLAPQGVEPAAGEVQRNDLMICRER